MSFWNVLPIIDRVTKWFDEWKNNAALRKSRKLGSIREELAKVETRLWYYERKLNKKTYPDYIRLLKRKRMLSKKIRGMAR